MSELQLTPAEQKLIELKREEERIKAEKEAVEKAQKIEKAIQEKKFIMQNDLLAADKQRDAVATFFKDFPKGWEMKDKVEKRTYTAYSWVGDKYDKKDIHWEEEVDVKTSFIEKEGYKVLVEKHIVDTSGRYSYRPHYKDKGWGMKVKGPGFDYKEEERFYKRVGTVVDKIDTKINTKKSEEKAKNSYEVYARAEFKKLQEKYPEAEMKLEHNWKRYSYSKHGEGYYMWEAPIKFQNGVSVTIRFHSNQTTTRSNFGFPEMESPLDLVDMFSEMKFSQYARNVNKILE